MNTLTKLSLSASLLGIVSIPAAASVVVNSPTNGANVPSPFTLSAIATSCSNQPVTAMGYSFDANTYTAVFSGQSMDGPVTVADGAHILHVKAWGNAGAGCDTDVAITVGNTSSLVPSYANIVSSIQALGNWSFLHDAATPGWSSGAMAVVNSPSLSGWAREFYTVYGNYGGERYSVAYSDNEADHNFLYDGWVYLTDSTVNLANLELDLYQVMPNSQTALFGMQCDGWTGTWDYFANWTGPYAPSNSWMHSGAPCNIRSWGRNQWHHIQLSYSRTDYGVVTYHGVWVDGRYQAINATAPTAIALGWGPVLLTNFQVDGANNAGSITIYLDKLVVSGW